MSEPVQISDGSESEEGSFLYEIVSLFLLVGLIYFFVRGGLILGFRTVSPMVSVSSPSMTHSNGSWEEYYVSRGLDPSQVEDFPFQNGLQKGDLVFIQGLNSIEDLRIGDVVVYWKSEVGGSKRIIHRVVKIEDNDQYITTKGDANAGVGVYEKKIGQEQIIGKAVFSVPYLGYPSVGFNNG